MDTSVPLCDNPSGHYCQSCRATGVSHCADPSYIGETKGCRAMEKMICHDKCIHQIKEPTMSELNRRIVTVKVLQGVPDQSGCIERMLGASIIQNPGLFPEADIPMTLGEKIDFYLNAGFDINIQMDSEKYSPVDGAGATAIAGISEPVNTGLRGVTREVIGIEESPFMESDKDFVQKAFLGGSPNPMVEAVDIVNKIAGRKRTGGWAALKKQADMLGPEVKELHDAIAERNLPKARDAIADVLVIAMGHGSVTPIPVEEDFFRVTDALHSRFDTTEERGLESLARHTERGIKAALSETIIDGTSYWVCKTTEACTDVDGEDYPIDKFLKSKFFHEPVFSPIDFDHEI